MTPVAGTAGLGRATEGAQTEGGAGRVRLSATVSAKMTADERRAIVKSATAAGLSVSEWGRREMLRAVAGRTAAERYVAAELAALGAALVEVLKFVAPDEARVRAVLTAAEASRFKMAEARWRRFAEGAATE